jgi:hypothetical protein
MRLIDAIEVTSGSNKRRIELYQGDLTSLNPHDAVDVLVVSAFPNDYTPTSTSLIGALYNKGVVVSDLARSKSVDLRDSFSCWMSPNVNAPDSGIQFRRILCFEPSLRSTPVALVGDIFRALAPFLGDDPPVSTVAMPLITSGDQGYPVALVLPALIEAAVHWLKIGLPLNCLKIVAYSDRSAHEAESLFVQMRQKYLEQDSTSSHGFDYDVFLSYSRHDAAAATEIEELLTGHRLRVFFDSHSIEKGVAWQQHIFSALDSCAKMIAMYSPAYITSKVCQEEFNIAWARARKLSQKIIFPVYWQTADLPTYMEMLDYFDCREEEESKIAGACDALMAALRD